MRRRQPLMAKPMVVVVGTGWAGSRCIRDLSPSYCHMVVLSQRNHMVFTPLLPQTCTGTLEFRSICEPITRIQPALAQSPNDFYRTMVFDVALDRRLVSCVSVGVMGTGAEAPVKAFDLQYDYLVLAHGARPSTFNVPGVEEYAFFLREISEARGIRRRLIQNIMTAKLPTTDVEEKRRLLHVVVVGGGPTGVEFAGDLADFLKDDIPKIYPSLQRYFQLTLVEANEVLGAFDTTLRNYAATRLSKMGIELRKAVVAEVTSTGVILSDGEVLPAGLVVWSTGVGPTTMTAELSLDKTRQGRIVVDDTLNVLKDGRPLPEVFAIGDCAANREKPLPTLAAVASRQGNYVAARLNQILASKPVSATPFVYKHLGSMSNLGQHKALVELDKPGHFDITGVRAFIIWRSAYLTMIGSIRSRLYVFVNWCGSSLFGRDVTYISEISESKLWKNMAREGASREQTRRRLLREAAQQQRDVYTAVDLAKCDDKPKQEEGGTDTSDEKA